MTVMATILEVKYIAVCLFPRYSSEKGQYKTDKSEKKQKIS
ncbi:hypothetical protein HMPREF1228_1592 [Streptococcus pyogenes GA41345]|nr:hypothetical protein HMPREF1228_1592 [Streptococcus pyogenes GA41345]